MKPLPLLAAVLTAGLLLYLSLRDREEDLSAVLDPSAEVVDEHGVPIEIVPTPPATPPGAHATDATAALEEELAAPTAERARARTEAAYRARPGVGIAGTVVDADGRPAAGVWVSALRHYEGESAGMSIDRWRTGDRHRARVDSTGTFHLTELPPGPWFVRASTACPDDWFTLPAEAAPGFTSSRIVRVEVPSAPIRLALLEPLTLRIRVVDDRGEALRPLTVWIEHFGDEEELVDPDVVGLFTGDDRDMERSGGWEIIREVDDEASPIEVPGLVPGTWSVKVNHGDDGESRELVLPRDGTELTFVFERPATVRGLVVDPRGRPVARAEVHAFQRDDVVDWTHGELPREDSCSSTATTDEGRYVLRDLPAEPLALVAYGRELAASEPLELALDAGQELDAAPLTLRPGGELEVDVRDARGERTTPRWIRVETRHGRELRSARGVEPPFVFRGLLPGEYVVAAHAMAPGGEVLFPRQVATVRTGARTTVTLGELAAVPIRVTGRVLRGREGVAGARIFWHHRVDGEPAREWEAYTDPHGGYSVVVDGSGTYWRVVKVSSFPNQMEFGAVVELPERSEVAHDVVLPRGSISGVLCLRNGGPLREEQLGIGPDPAAHDLEHEVYGSFTTDAQGRFSFTELPAGTYRMAIDGEHVGFRSGIVLREGEQLGGVDLVVEPSAILGGTVRDQEGSPAAFGDVCVVYPDARSPVYWDMVWEGTFRMSQGLSAGPAHAIAIEGRFVSRPSPLLALVPDREITVDLTLVEGGSLRVRATNDVGRPISLDLRVLDEGGFDWAAATEQFDQASDREDGTLFAPLPPGTYRVEGRDGYGDSVSAEVRIDTARETEVTLAP